MAKGSAISEWIAFFGAPEIMMVGKDSRVIGEFSQEFSTTPNIISQSVITGHHQSLGAAERRHRLFRTIIDHVIGGIKPKNLSNNERKEFASMAMMHLNSKVRQYDGFTPGRRVFGGTPKLRIGGGGSITRFSKIL